MKMKKLLFKELRLCLTPQAIVFCCLSSLIIIPSWPSIVAFVYTFMAFIVIFPMAIANHDMEYTAILPVRKKDIVKGKALLAMSIEIISILISIPFALIKVFFINGSIPATDTYSDLGINLVLYGIVLALSGLFNLIFIPWYYKNPYKTAKPQIFTTFLIMVVMISIVIIFVSIPEATTFVNTFSGIALIVQFISLFAGLLLFLGLSALAAYLGGKRLEKIDL